MKKVKSFSKKLLCILMILMTIGPSLIQTVSLATDISEAYLQDRGDCGLHLQYQKDDGTWSFVTCTFVTYNQNGVEYPAYCLNRELPGVGEKDSYTVDINSALDDVRIWRVIKNAYPYQSPAAMGVENQYDAFVATKQAVYCILYGFNPSTRYRGGDDRGTAIANAITNLVNEGRYGTETPYSAGISVNKVGSLTAEGDTYYQVYNVSAGVEISQYTITSSAGLPSGSRITDTSGNEKSTYSSGQNFKVVIPKTSITSNVNATLAVQAKCKIYPVFYGRTTVPGTQNYAVTYDPFGDVSGIANLNIEANGKIDLSKLSADNNIWTGTLKGQGVANATYIIKNSDGAVVKEIKTGNNGGLEVTLPVGSYTIEESVSPDYFLKDDKVYSFTIAYHGDNATVNVNEKVVEGGFFSAKKVSEKNNIWTGHKANQAVEGAKYGLYNENGDLLDTKISTKDGTLWNRHKLKNRSLLYFRTRMSKMV